MRIGIPRGLFYYYYGPLWIAFFKALGAEVVISEKTNKAIVDQGIKCTVDEVCLPVKVYHGHVIDLKDRVDAIFVPKIMSIYEGEYICPKFCAIPDMVKGSIKDLPTIIEPVINFHRSRKDLFKVASEAAKVITSSKKDITHALNIALNHHKMYRKEIRQGLLPIDIEEKISHPSDNGPKILLMGHPYNIYDAYLSMNMIHKLRRYGAKVITQDSYPTKIVNERAKTMDKRVFWSFGRKVLGASLEAMEQEDILGMIYLSSFSCGIDSAMAEIVERKVRRDSNKPFILLTIDEHTGEAGLDTRIEAFVDMIKWRGKNENNLSSYGEYLSAR